MASNILPVEISSSSFSSFSSSSFVSPIIERPIRHALKRPVSQLENHLSLIYVSVCLRLSLRFCVFLQKSVPALTTDINFVLTRSTDGTMKARNITDFFTRAPSTPIPMTPGPSARPRPRPLRCVFYNVCLCVYGCESHEVRPAVEGGRSNSMMYAKSKVVAVCCECCSRAAARCWRTRDATTSYEHHPCHHLAWSLGACACAHGVAVAGGAGARHIHSSRHESKTISQ